jgi:ectoine hydroxylase-related dioxygenase (phytanoyl-CoA dioxygenase family)
MIDFTLEGYTILDNMIPISYLDSLYDKFSSLRIVRASTSNKTYREGLQVAELTDISVYWTELVTDFPEVKSINDILHNQVKNYLSTAILYTSDIVVINPNSTWVSPHVDTPHRFTEYNFDKRLLGIQCIVPLFDLSNNNGATGVVPKSHTKNFDIDFCYNGKYNNYFLDNVIQPNISKGSALMYNCRVLHSSMPNPTNIVRPALLLNYLDSDIVNSIRPLDNVWSSNA